MKKVLRPTNTHKQTGPITIHCAAASLARSVINIIKTNISNRKMFINGLDQMTRTANWNCIDTIKKFINLLNQINVLTENKTIINKLNAHCC